MRNIFKKVLLIIILIIVFSFSKSLAIQIKNIHIGEKTTDPSWIEVFSDDYIPNLNDYKILSYRPSSKTPKKNHKISNRVEDDNDFSIESNSTFYISNSKTEPSFSGRIFYSAFSVAANGGTVSIFDKNNTILSCIGYKNINCSQNDNSATTDNSTTTKTEATDYDNKTTEIIKYIYVPMNNQDKYGDIQVLIPESKIVMALADTDYKVSAIDSHRQKIDDLTYHFSFGDGGEAKGQSAVYHYTYPGDYLLIASADGFSGGAKGEMKVKVVPPEIKIIKVGGNNGENYIDLENNSDYDLYLSDFNLEVDGKVYKLPKDLLLAANSITHISGEAIGFKLPAKSVSLNYPNMTLLDKYNFQNNVSTTTINSTTSSTTLNIQYNNKIINKEENKQNTLSEEIGVSKPNYSDLKYEVSPDLVEANTSQNYLENVTSKIITLKRLVLDNGQNVQNNLAKNSNIDKVKNKQDVDTGIINWFKNLLY